MLRNLQEQHVLTDSYYFCDPSTCRVMSSLHTICREKLLRNSSWLHFNLLSASINLVFTQNSDKTIKEEQVFCFCMHLSVEVMVLWKKLLCFLIVVFYVGFIHMWWFLAGPETDNSNVQRAQGFMEGADGARDVAGFHLGQCSLPVWANIRMGVYRFSLRLITNFLQ